MFTPATGADLPVLAALMNRAYRGAASATAWTTEAAYITGDRTSEAQLRVDLQTPGAALLKWVGATGAIEGCVWLEPLGDDGWYLGSLTADSERQNAGLGRTMLAAAEQWVAARGGQRVRMTVVNVRAPLIAWYERRGCRLTGETEPFPYHDAQFGTPLRPDLHFVVLEKRLA